MVVPVEPQSSLDLFRKMEQKVRPRLLLLGDRVPAVNSSGKAVAERLVAVHAVTLQSTPVIENRVERGVSSKVRVVPVIKFGS